MNHVIVVALLLSVNSASAYELLRVNHNSCRRDDQNLFWRSPSVGVSVTSLSEPFDALAVEALDRWNLSLTRFTFGLSSGTPCTRDGVAAISIDDLPCGRPEGFGDALAITRSIWTSAGALVDADVTFRPNTFVLNDPEVFRHVTMHELGHVLGLDHSDGCGGSGVGTLMKAAFMFPAQQAPQADDIDGAEFIYRPSGGGDGTVPSGTNSCAIVSPAHDGGLALPFLAIFGLLALRAARTALPNLCGLRRYTTRQSN